MNKSSFLPNTLQVRPSRGFVALISAVIFSLLLMGLVFSESAAAFWTLYDQIDQEGRGASATLAESCMYTALLQYAEDPNSLSQSKTVSLKPGACTIDPLLIHGSTITFTTHAIVANVPSVLIVTATDDSGALSVTSWRTATSIPP